MNQCIFTAKSDNQRFSALSAFYYIKIYLNDVSLSIWLLCESPHFRKKGKDIHFINILMKLTFAQIQVTSELQVYDP